MIAAGGVDVTARFKPFAENDRFAGAGDRDDDVAAAYGGCMMGFIAYVSAGRDPQRTGRMLARSIAVAAIVIATQGLLLP